jgi:hypothetical protein
LGVNTAAGPTGEVRATGSITAGYSDERLKDIVSVIGDSLNKLDTLRGVYFVENNKAKQFGFNNNNRQVGVIAQDVNAVLPEAVDNAPFDIDSNCESISGENYLTVMYERITPLLIEALKQQKEQIEYIKSKL